MRISEALKTLENLAKFLESEIARIANSSDIPDACYVDLKKAHLQAIDLGTTIQTARAWGISRCK